MQIIKAVKVFDKNTKVTFICPGCGTLFGATLGEFHVGFKYQNGDVYRNFDCPICHTQQSVPDKELQLVVDSKESN